MNFPAKLLDHYRAPRHKGTLDDATHRGHHRNLLCGDEITLDLRMDGDRIDAAAFQGVGCVYCIAGADLLCAMDQMPTPEELVDALQAPVPEARRECVLVALEAARTRTQSDKAEGAMT